MEKDVKELEGIVRELRNNLEKVETVIARLKLKSQTSVKKIFLNLDYRKEDDVTKASRVVDWGVLENDAFVKRRIVARSEDKNSTTERLTLVENIFNRVTEMHQEGILFVINNVEWYLLFNLIIDGDVNSRASRLLCQNEVISRHFMALRNAASACSASVTNIEGLEGETIFNLWKAFKSFPI